jgi:hypothetical protein
MIAWGEQGCPPQKFSARGMLPHAYISIGYQKLFGDD